MTEHMTRAERARLSVLDDYRVLDRKHAPALVELVERAARVLDVEAAAISFVDNAYERFAAAHGAHFDDIPRSRAPGNIVIRNPEPLVVPDIRCDELLRDTELAGRHPELVFYAAVPLVSPEQAAVGTLAVFARTPRNLSDRQIRQLCRFGDEAVETLEAGRTKCAVPALGWLRERARDGDAVADAELRRVFDVLPAGCVLFEPRRFEIVAVSDAFLSMAGVQREEIVGRSVFEVFPADPDDPESERNVNALRDSLERVRREGVADELPVQRYPIPLHDGGFTERYWNARNVPVFDSDRSLRWIIHYTDDVTDYVRLKQREGRVAEEKQALASRAHEMEANILDQTRELKRVNDRLRMAHRVANIASWEIRVGENASVWSEELYHLLGIPPRSAPESLETFLKYVHREDRDAVRRIRSRAVKGDVPASFEHRIVREDGEVRYVQERGEVVYGEDGRPVLLYGTIQDVTEYKRVERKLAERARHQAVIAQLGRKALEETSLQSFWDAVVRAVADTFEVEYCKILKCLPDDAGVKLVAGVGWKEGLVGNAIVDTGRNSQAGYTLISNDPVVVADLRTEARFNGPPLLHEHGVVSGISTIIPGPAGPWGVLGAHTRRRRDFSPDDISFFQNVANLIGETNRRSEDRERIRESEARTRAIIDTALDAVISIDGDSNIIGWNPQAATTFGWSAEEALGKRLYDLIIPSEYRAAHRSGMARYKSSGEGPILNRRVELNALHRDGHEFPVELSISPLQTGGGLEFSAFVRDITERNRTEAALRESEERFRIIARATADTIWDWNLATDNVWWNEGMQAVFGYSPGDIEPDSRSFVNRIHPDDRERVLAAVRSTLAGDSNEWQAEYRFRRADGSMADVTVRGFVIRDEKGKPMRMVGAMNDVTLRREYETRLEQQAALLDKARDAIIVRDMEHRITYWNRSAERVYGWSAAEARGQRLDELLDEDRETFARASRELVANGEWVGEVEHRDKYGRRIVSEVAWSLVTDEDDRPQSILAINTDITERLALEEQLRQSQRLEAVGQLTGGVAHDFNNLLTVILGNAELMAEQLPQGDRMHKLAEMTRTAAQRGAELTHRLLAFARRQALEPAPLDVNRLVSGMESLLRRTLPETIDLEIVPGDDTWNAFADTAQLESVILNLALNSKDAMPDGGRLTIETANVRLDEEYCAHNAEVAPGRYVMIAVSDTGTGIPPEHLNRVFDPFFTTKEKGKGTGLGLSMAYGFAKQSQGHIKIYSEPGQGTTVKVYLPRAQRREERIEPSTRAERDYSGTEKILVVEDNDLVREHAERQLEQFGYEVRAASNGREALEIIKREEDIDLLFTDVIMSGGMNGRDLAEMAKKIRPRLKVLYTSGYTENAIVHHGRLDKGVNLLQKPYHRADLARKVRAVLSESADRVGDDS